MKQKADIYIFILLPSKKFKNYSKAANVDFFLTDVNVYIGDEGLITHHNDNILWRTKNPSSFVPLFPNYLFLRVTIATIILTSPTSFHCFIYCIHRADFGVCIHFLYIFRCLKILFFFRIFFLTVNILKMSSTLFFFIQLSTWFWVLFWVIVLFFLLFKILTKFIPIISSSL